MRYDSYFVRIRICKRFEIRSPRDSWAFPGILKETLNIIKHLQMLPRTNRKGFLFIRTKIEFMD